MVWFQCEDCGENLKKPKLPNHFRICSAFKLSCIDCGQTFGQDSVQGHTQCITEAEKYGPKGAQAKPLNGATPKSNKDAKQKPEVDINVGLSERPPWFCCLCNTKATSKQTLLLHADGKKHRAKARAFHAAKQPKQTEESAPDSNVANGNTVKGELLGSKPLEEQKVQDFPNADCENVNSEVQNGDLPSKTKRKHDSSESDGTVEKTGDCAIYLSNGAKAGETENRLKKAKHNMLKDDKERERGNLKEETKSKIKWKRLIKSTLKTNPDGVLKMKKLKILVLKSLHESGIAEDETQLGDILEHKINSSSRFRVEGKYVHLMAED